MTQLTDLIQFPLVNSQIQADDVTVTKLNWPTVACSYWTGNYDISRPQQRNSTFK